MIVYHLSNQPGITRFEPRPAPSPGSGQTGLMVWAVDADHVQNYLLPRDCPRVTFYATPDSRSEDVTRLMAGTTATYVVAIESRWLPELRRQRLFCYEFASDNFTVVDAGAGYSISRQAVIPQRMTVVPNLLTALLARPVELRIMPSLWALSDAVAASSLQFSMIRMRNAQPRPA